MYYWTPTFVVKISAAAHPDAVHVLTDNIPAVALLEITVFPGDAEAMSFPSFVVTAVVPVLCGFLSVNKVVTLVLIFA